MATEDSPADGGRDAVRILLIIGCLVAAVAAAVLTPATVGSGLAGSPLDRVFPGEQLPTGSGGDTAQLEQADSISGGSTGGLGALQPGERTGVGGDVGFDNESFGSNDTEIHFVVESSEPAYWRTGAYDRYTGTGWEQTGEPVAYERPIEHEGYSDGQIEYEVTLERPATAIPTVWRPRTVTGVDGLQVTDTGAVQSEQRLAAGTTYTGVSRTAERDVQLLRATGQSYPDDIGQRYTQLPADTPDRVESFTAALTSDDDNPYDTAMTVQQWLRANKSYSLEAAEQSDHMAATFIFEMEEGYCEYFATSMVAMLRSQDIPARYTVGYSTGQQVQENTYEVRGMNAHAWVEVYFEDVGWVRFDPTPGGDRLASQAAALDDAGIDEGVVEEAGSPGETFEPGNTSGEELPPPPSDGASDGTADLPDGADNGTADLPDESRQGDTGDEGTDSQQEDDSEPGDDGGQQTDDQNADDQRGEDPNETDSGGQQESDGGPAGNDQQDDSPDGSDDSPDDDSVSYETTLNRTAVPGATVEVTVTADGDPAVGREVSFNGEAVGHTDEQGVVTGTVPYDEELRITVEDTDTVRTAAIETPPRQTERVYHLAEVPSSALAGSAGLPAQEDTYPVETNATVTVSGETLPGETVVVSALVEDVAVPDATVTVDGEAVNRTDERGRASVTLPEEPGNVTIGVERSPVSGETTVSLPALSLSVEPTLPLALPYTTARAEVTAGETAVVGAPVTVDGQQVATTGPDGTASVRLPFTSATDIGTTAHGMSRVTTVGGLLRNLAFLLAGVVALVVGVGIALARRGYRPRDLFAALRSLPAKTVHAVQWLLVTLVTRGDVLLKRGFDRLQNAVAQLVALARGQQSLDVLVANFRTWLRVKMERLRPRAGTDTGATGETTAADQSAPDVTVREAWVRFIGHTSVQQVPHRTPGELSRHAIEEDGLPPDAVRTMRDVFREVEYGSRSPAERVERVERAIDNIERDGQRTERGES